MHKSSIENQGNLAKPMLADALSVEDCNKLIANFMCLTKGDSWQVANGLRDYKRVDELEFNKDWNLLISVVEKIENLDDSELHYKWNDIDTKNRSNFNGYSVDIEGNECFIWLHLELEPAEKCGHFRSESKINSVYYAVVQFIQWHNEFLNIQGVSKGVT